MNTEYQTVCIQDEKGRMALLKPQDSAVGGTPNQPQKQKAAFLTEMRV